MPASLEKWFVRYLFQTHRVSPGKIFANMCALAKWPLRAYTLKLAYLRGRSLDEVQSWITSVWENEIIHRIYRGWYEAIPRLQAQNGVIVLLSGTPRPLAQPLMELFQIQYAICAEPEIIQGQYSGRLLKPHPIGLRKALYASEWLKAHGHDWHDAVAMGDHWGDRFLLNRANPVVVHPGRRLARYARQHHWPIVGDANDGRQIMEGLERSANCKLRDQNSE